MTNVLGRQRPVSTAPSRHTPLSRRFAAIVGALALALTGTLATATGAVAGPTDQSIDFQVHGDDGRAIPGVTILFSAVGKPSVSQVTNANGIATFFAYPSAADVGTEPWGPGVYVTPGTYNVHYIAPDSSAYDDNMVPFVWPDYSGPEVWFGHQDVTLPDRFVLPTDFGVTVDCTGLAPTASVFVTPVKNDSYPGWVDGTNYYTGFVEATVDGRLVLQGDPYGPLGTRIVVPLDTSLRNGDVINASLSSNHDQTTVTTTVACGLKGTANSRYITHVYQDLFGRVPDPAGLAAWTAALDSGTPRIAVSNGITYSTEYRSGLITGVYDRYLGRAPDATGLANWLIAMGQGITVSQMEAGFIASNEYYAAAGSTLEGWVGALYEDVLGRQAAPAEIASWVRILQGGTSRQAVSMGFLLSTERLNTVIAGHYSHLLGRGIDTAGQAAWVAILQAGGRDEAVIGGIIASDEYYASS